MIFPTPPADQPWTLRARWVFPGDAPPIADGRITIEGPLIRGVASSGPADVDLGNVAILPGFVNAHTHLDLGMLRGRCPPTPDLIDWLRRVIAGRRAATTEDAHRAIADGIAESVRYGTTLLGDISAGGASWPFLFDAPLRSVVFYELIGLPGDRADAAAQAFLHWLRPLRLDGHSRPGLSPHASYSVNRYLFQRSAQWAWEYDLPLATHLGESQAELQLLRERAGPFVKFLEDLGVWDPRGLVDSPVEVLDRCLSPLLSVVHANYLDADTPFAPNHTVIYCPRTHAAFGHAPHPLPAFLDRGVRVALGTDSLASNPDLDMLAEARFVHARYPDLPGAAVLRMLTLSGAEALGWANETGSLRAGKAADMVVLPLPDDAPADPHRLLWESAASVQAVLCRSVPV